MSMKVFKSQLDDHVGAEKSAELLDVAKKCVRFGFRQWAWYKVAEQTIIRNVGFNDLVTEVVGEILLAERDGLEWQDAITRAQAVTLKRLRPLFSFEYGQHDIVSLEGHRLGGRQPLLPTAPPEDSGLREKMEAVLTPFQMQVVDTVASVGGPSEAARWLGLNSRTQVSQALRNARRRLEAAGITPARNVP